MNVKAVMIGEEKNSWQRRTSSVLVGKDLLELLTSSMYIDPLTIYREYVQNAADSIDDGRREGLLKKNTGRVEISLDPDRRIVRIRDNGMGIHAGDFEERLRGLGASIKRGTLARGFRGVGRLAGIGYCQELIFRSRASSAEPVVEMRWDCRNIKTMLRSSDLRISLQDVVNDATEMRTQDSRSMAGRFFEVELNGIVRHKNDALLNSSAVYQYLSEVAPVPFDPAFVPGQRIRDALSNHIALGEIAIQIDGIESPVYRPHRNEIAVNNPSYDTFSDLEICELPSVDGTLGGIACFLHHDYKGVIPNPAIRGLRLRTGNIQVGGSALLENLFSETRFNSWTVGEVHTVDHRVIPNGRRDHYEQNVHFNNLIDHVSPLARKISLRCRQSSISRNLIRDFERRQAEVEEKLKIFRQGSVGSQSLRSLASEIEGLLNVLRRIASRESLTKELRVSLDTKIRKLERTVSRIRKQPKSAKALSLIPAKKRKIYEEVFALIYDCSTNQGSAHNLVEQILDRLWRSANGTAG
jgi:Histidine kinase-, DNA gyrase B-, and HSP90-like ATPase